MPKITLYLCVWNRFRELQTYIRRHSPHVDRTVIIEGGSKDESLDFLRSQECRDLNVETYIHEWRDSPPEFRNHFFKYAGLDGWALSLDVDELLEDPAIYTIRQIAEDAEKRGIGTVKFNAHDIRISEDGKVWEHCSNYHNPNFWKLTPHLQYVGGTHVGLAGRWGGEEDSKYRYFHIKTYMDEWLRASRNYFTTSQPAQNTHDSAWIEFRTLCNKYQLKYFYMLEALMQAGTVPEEIVKWMDLNKDDDNAEKRAYFVCYRVYIHPELNPGMSNRDYPYDSDRKPIRGMKF